MKTELKILSGAAAITKAIVSIQNRGAKLDNDVQAVGLSCIMHIEEHGDFTLAEKLVQALPKGARRLALVEWFLAFGMVSTLKKGQDEKEDEAIKAGRIFKLDRTKQTDCLGASERPWYEFRKEAEVQDAFDAAKAVHAVLQRLKSAESARKTVQGRAEALAEARALVLALEAQPKADEAAPV